MKLERLAIMLPCACFKAPHSSHIHEAFPVGLLMLLMYGIDFLKRCSLIHFLTEYFWKSAVYYLCINLARGQRDVSLHSLYMNALILEWGITIDNRTYDCVDYKDFKVICGGGEILCKDTCKKKMKGKTGMAPLNQHQWCLASLLIVSGNVLEWWTFFVQK